MTSTTVWDSFRVETEAEELMPHALQEWTDSDWRIAHEPFPPTLAIERSMRQRAYLASKHQHLLGPAMVTGPSEPIESLVARSRILDSLIRVVLAPNSQTVKPDSVAVVQLLGVLSDQCWLSAPAPHISPTESGGLTAEFRTPNLEIQVESDSSGELSAYVVDLLQMQEWEGPLDQVPGGLHSWATRLRG